MEHRGFEVLLGLTLQKIHNAARRMLRTPRNDDAGAAPLRALGPDGPPSCWPVFNSMIFATKRYDGTGPKLYPSRQLGHARRDPAAVAEREVGRSREIPPGWKRQHDAPGRRAHPEGEASGRRGALDRDAENLPVMRNFDMSRVFRRRGSAAKAET